MKYILIISIALNTWFQFRENIFYEYVDYHYCPGSSTKGVQFSEYNLLGFHFLHISHVVPPNEYATVNCMDGKNNLKKDSL